MQEDIDTIQEIIEDLIARLEKATKIQQNMTNVLVRQSMLIAKLNERVIKFEDKEVEDYLVPKETPDYDLYYVLQSLVINDGEAQAKLDEYWSKQC